MAQLRRRAWIACLALAVSGCFLERAPLLGEHDGALHLDAGARDGSEPSSDAVIPDGCTPELELCDGIDNDCDPSTPDGRDEPTFGDACDGGDADACAGGTIVCDDGALRCAEGGGDRAEVCDGIDNDCDPATLDGADEPTLGEACDADDADACRDGTITCTAGALVCSGDGGDDPSEIELCDGIDNDCRAETADGASDSRVGASCDGTDGDLCAEGTTSCIGGAIACGDTTDTTRDTTCNGIDDDCDGVIDSDPACPCRFATFGGHTYLFCEGGGDRLGWSGARSACPMGYDLVKIESAAENAFVQSIVAAVGADFWIGALWRPARSRFEWAVDSTPVPLRGGSGYQNWGAGLPDGSGNCVEMDGDASSGVLGSWNDAACSQTQRYVCETRP